LEAKKKADEKGKARASTTDGEATVMEMAGGGCRPACNAPPAAAAGGVVIPAVSVIATGGDMGLTGPLAGRVEGRTGVRPGEALAGGGFAHHQGMGQARAAGTTAHVPAPEPEDPKRNRREPMPKDSGAMAAWRKRLETDKAKEIHQERAATAGCVNAQARNRGLARLLARGAHEVKAIALGCAIAHNIRRWFSLRGGWLRRVEPGEKGGRAASGRPKRANGSPEAIRDPEAMPVARAFPPRPI